MDLCKYDIKQEIPPRFNDWKESVPVVVLSDALKIVGQKHGISLYRSEDGRPALHFTPGMKASAVVGSERWNVAEQITGYFLAAVDDLQELIAAGKITLPPRRTK